MNVEILIVIGAIIVGLVVLVLLFWLATALGVIAFIAYVISSATGIPFQFLFIVGIIVALVLFVWSLVG